jgi:hypothetical protein
MAEQLDRLITAAQNPKINIQVVPTSLGANPGLSGALAIASTQTGDIVYQEGTTKPQISDRAEDVAAVMRFYDALRAVALPTDQSLDVLKKAKESWT